MAEREAHDIFEPEMRPDEIAQALADMGCMIATGELERVNDGYDGYGRRIITYKIVEKVRRRD